MYLKYFLNFRCYSVPPRVEYSLTKHGEELIVALKGLADWGSKIASM
ncbi:MAG: winged helix-turn-helix transcriptional regulator [Tissierellales bacterium]|nr:winged helix-turn-helix transcriptional regulator [Tissierellales bacterium]